MKGPLKPELRLGAENKKKVGLLAGLVVVLVGVWWFNRSSTPEAAPAPRPAPATAAPAPGIRTPVVRPRAGAAGPRTGVATRSSQFGGGRGQSVQEFKPSLIPETPIDPATVDPTLRLDLLAKLQTVRIEGGSRSLFDFGQSAPPKVEIANVNPILPKRDNGIKDLPQQPPKPGPPPPPPPPPPIPLKFYGFSAQRRGSVKRAFFLEGDDIFIAGEGETIKQRYKVIRIGVNSAVVEDLTNKNQQTLPLAEEAQQS